MNKSLSDRIHDYVSGLSKREVREELEKVYLHMYRCTEVLRGKLDTEPVSIDDEECIAEELFYLCKKKGIESALDKIVDSFTDAVNSRLSSFDFSTTLTNRPTGQVRRMKYYPGETVYYFNGRICHSVIDTIAYDEINGWEVTLGNGTVLKGFDGLFGSENALTNHLKNYLNGKK